MLDQLHAGWQHLEGQLKALAERLKEFAAAAPAKEAEARAKLATIPGVGPVTVDVVVSELGDVSRFHSVKAVCAYAGLVPAVRQSGGKRRRTWGSPRTGSPLLRWALVEAAWRVIRQGAAWRRVYEQDQEEGRGQEGDRGGGASAAGGDGGDAPGRDELQLPEGRRGVPDVAGRREPRRPRSDERSGPTSMRG